MQIGTGIQLQRLKKGLTQPDLARLSGIAQANLSNIEKGKRDLNLSTLRKISFALGLPAWELLRWAEEAQADIRLTRDDLEGLAKAVLGDSPKKLRIIRADLLSALKGVLLLRPDASDKSLERDWAQVSRAFSRKDIEAIRSRVNDERTRRL